MYFLSILCIFKNEGMNMLTWLEHYKWQGVQAFYMIDNGSTDNSCELIQQFFKDNPQLYLYLTHKPKKYAQLEHYCEVYDQQKLRESTKWLIICDLDEFFYTSSDNIFVHLQQYSHYKVILSYFRLFGSNGYKKHPRDIRKSLTKRKKDLDSLGKYIFQTEFVSSDMLDIHHINNMDVSEYFFGDSVFHLNHYIIQSEEFFQKVKTTRGDAFRSESDKLRDLQYFQKFNEDNDFVDFELRNILVAQNQNQNNPQQSIFSLHARDHSRTNIFSNGKIMMLLILLIFLYYAFKQFVVKN